MGSPEVRIISRKTRDQLRRELQLKGGPALKSITEAIEHSDFPVSQERWLAMLDYIELDVSRAILDSLKAEEPVVGRPRFQGDPGSEDWQAWSKHIKETWGVFNWFSEGKKLGYLDDRSRAVKVIALMEGIGKFGKGLRAWLTAYDPPEYVGKP